MLDLGMVVILLVVGFLTYLLLLGCEDLMEKRS